MRIPESEEERPLAWSAVLEATPVLASDGIEVGVVHEVLGSIDEDIFHGVAVRLRVLGSDILIPAGSITTMTNRRIATSLTSEEVRALPPYQEEHSYGLGFVGLIRRRLGWTDESQGPH